MRALCVIFLFFFAWNSLHSQTETINSPFLVTSSGGTLIQQNYNLCFSLGEIAIETLSQQDLVFTQGFHQENYQITHISETSERHKINLYPNPTQDLLYVNCNIEESVNLKLKDTKGGVISLFSKVFGGEIQVLDLAPLPAGTYFLEIEFKHRKNQNYQIQKFN